MNFTDLIALTERYPLDLTAQSETNYVGNVEYTLPATGPKVIYLNEGFFYTESLIVFDPDQSKALERGVDYYVLQMNHHVEVQSAHRAACYIYIKDPLVASRVEVSAQFVGGYYALCLESIIELYNTVVWSSIAVFTNEMNVGTISLFAADHPLYDSQDRYGFTYMVAALDRLRNAISYGDGIAWDEFYNTLEAMRSDIEIKSAQLAQDVLGHTDNKQNPHGTTADDIGAVTSTDIQALNQAITQIIAQAVSTLTTSLGNVATTINNHISNTNNPHQLTAAKMGAATSTYINGLAANLTARYNELVIYINNNFHPKNTFWWSYQYWLRSYRPSDDTEALLNGNTSSSTTWARMGRSAGGGDGGNATQIEFAHSDNSVNMFVGGANVLNIYPGERILLRAELIQMIENAKCRCTFVCNRCDCTGDCTSDCGGDTYCTDCTTDCDTDCDCDCDSDCDCDCDCDCGT